MKNVSIIGSSDMAVHMASYLSNSDYNIIGFFDDYRQKDTMVSGFKILGKINEVKDFLNKLDEIFIGIGYKYLREKEYISQFLKSNNIKLGKYIHTSSYNDISSTIGCGTFILPNCTIDKNVNIGENIFINPNCNVSHDSSIGSETFLGPGVIISGKTKIGKRCFMGAGTVIKDCLSICDDVFIGAGSVVVKDITQPGLYYGVPAVKQT